MHRFALVLFLTFVVAPLLAQMPPPPPKEDMPMPPAQPEGKKKDSKTKKIIEPDKRGVKPPLPVTPPTPEPTAPDEP
jgi:hypothetical protein